MQPSNDMSFKDRVMASRDQLAAAERRVADYMLANPERAAAWSASELASAVKTSDATVVRTARSLGYGGMRELKRAVVLHTERRRDPSLVLGDSIAQSTANGPATLYQVMDDTSTLLSQVRTTVDPEAWSRALDFLSHARHVHAYGIGTAGGVTEFLQIALTRIGVAATSITHSGIRLADGLLRIQTSDTVIVFALIRRFSEVDTIIRHAERKRARVILVSEAAISRSLGPHVDVVLQIPTSTGATGSGVAVAVTLAHALQLAVATQRPDHAMDTMREMTELRTQIVGHALDTDPPAMPDVDSDDQGM